MLKTRRLFSSFTRATFLFYRTQIRHKTQCLEHTNIPAPFIRPPTISIKSPYSVKIEPIDPVEFGDVKAVVGFLYLETEAEEELSPKGKTAFQQDIKYEVKSVMSPSRDYVQVTCSEQQKFKYPSKDVSLHFHVPVDYGVEIEVRGDANVDVRNLEGQLYEIVTGQGSCELKNLRGSRLSVETNGGNIKCDSQLLFEFGILNAKNKGKISVKKLQGKKFCVDVEDGDISVEAVYLLRVELTSKGGHVRLGDIHGLTEINVDSGDISVGSASGKLKAVTRNGNIDVNLSHHDDVTLRSKEGSISIKILEESSSSVLQVKSQKIDVDSNVKLTINDEDRGENFTVMTAKLNPKEDKEEQARTITAEAKLGCVKFEKNDWFNSLKLK